MKTLEEIRNTINLQKEDLKQKYYIKEIGIFGSYVRGEQDDESDLDVLVEFEKPIGLFKFLELEEYLQETLGVKVDLVSRKALKPNIGKYILEDVIML